VSRDGERVVAVGAGFDDLVGSDERDFALPACFELELCDGGSGMFTGLSPRDRLPDELDALDDRSSPPRDDDEDAPPEEPDEPEDAEPELLGPELDDPLVRGMAWAHAGVASATAIATEIAV